MFNFSSAQELSEIEPKNLFTDVVALQRAINILDLNEISSIEESCIHQQHKVNVYCHKLSYLVVPV